MSDKPLELWVIPGIPAGTDTGEIDDPSLIERASLGHILSHPSVTDLLDEPQGDEHIRYALDALVTNLEQFLPGADPADVVDRMWATLDELKELI